MPPDDNNNNNNKMDRDKENKNNIIHKMYGYDVYSRKSSQIFWKFLISRHICPLLFWHLLLSAGFWYLRVLLLCVCKANWSPFGMPARNWLFVAHIIYMCLSYFSLFFIHLCGCFAASTVNNRLSVQIFTIVFIIMKGHQSVNQIYTHTHTQTTLAATLEKVSPGHEKKVAVYQEIFNGINKCHKLMLCF